MSDICFNYDENMLNTLVERFEQLKITSNYDENMLNTLVERFEQLKIAFTPIIRNSMSDTSSDSDDSDSNNSNDSDSDNDDNNNSFDYDSDDSDDSIFNYIERHNAKSEPHDQLDDSVFVKKFEQLETELDREDILFHYLDYMGIWSDEEIHFIDKSWEEMDTVLKDRDMKDNSYIFTDDIDLFRALQCGGCIHFSHMIVKEEDNDKVTAAFKKVFDIDIGNVDSKKTINIPVYNLTAIKKNHASITRELQEYLYHPDRIAKWINAGNNIEDYLP